MRPSTFLASTAVVLTASTVPAQLFDGLRSSVSRYGVGDPNVSSTRTAEGPKSLISADFDQDGSTDIAVSNADGSVTLLFFTIVPGENVGLEERVNLPTGGAGLRQIASADFNGDGKADLVTANPFDGKLHFFFNEHSPDASRSFRQEDVEVPVSTRNLSVADFDGDGAQDIVIAGSEFGLQYYRGDDTGAFSLASTSATLASPFTGGKSYFGYQAKPVYVLRTFTPVGKTLPTLVATHASSDTFIVYEVDTNLGTLAEVGSFTPELRANPQGQFHDFQIERHEKLAV